MVSSGILFYDVSVALSVCNIVQPAVGKRARVVSWKTLVRTCPNRLVASWIDGCSRSDSKHLGHGGTKATRSFRKDLAVNCYFILGLSYQYPISILWFCAGGGRSTIPLPTMPRGHLE